MNTLQKFHRKSLELIGSIQAVLFLAFVALPLAVYAQVVEKPPLDVLKEVLNAVQNSNWKLAASGGIVLLVYIVRHYGAKYLPWLLTKLGAATLTSVTAVALGVANYAAAGKHLDFQLLVDALVIAVTAFLPFLPALPAPEVAK